jgi:hypothetical protein
LKCLYNSRLKYFRFIVILYLCKYLFLLILLIITNFIEYFDFSFILLISSPHQQISTTCRVTQSIMQIPTHLLQGPPGTPWPTRVPPAQPRAVSVGSVLSVVHQALLVPLVPLVPLVVAHLLAGGWMGAQQRAERFTIHTPREPRGIGVDPADDPRLIAFREMLRKKNPVLMARDRFDDRHRTMARLREAQIEEEHRARERLLWTMRNRASQEWRQQHRARGDIAQTIAGMRADSPDSLADVSRYFDNLPDDDAQVVHGPSAAAPRTKESARQRGRRGLHAVHTEVGH